MPPFAPQHENANHLQVGTIRIGRLFGVSRWTAARWCQRGLLPAVLIGRKWAVDPALVGPWLMATTAARAYRLPPAVGRLFPLSNQGPATVAPLLAQGDPVGGGVCAARPDADGGPSRDKKITPKAPPS